MVSDYTSRSLIPTEAATLRQQASDLLNRLIAGREMSEQRLIETGRRDPMKSITGRTAFDVAIDSTREMVRHMDLLLSETNGDSRTSNPHLSQHRPSGRTQARMQGCVPFRPVPVSAAAS